MAAKINNLPLYVVYDRSYEQKVTTTFGGQRQAEQTLNPTGYMVNSNLVDYYGNYVECLGLSGGVNATTIIDYGKAFFNIQLSYKTSVSFTTGGTGKGSVTIYYSTDDVTYTQIETHTGITAEQTFTTSVTLLTARYVKFYFSSGAGVGGNALLGKIFEVRLMGSG